MDFTAVVRETFSTMVRSILEQIYSDDMVIDTALIACAAVTMLLFWAWKHHTSNRKPEELIVKKGGQSERVTVLALEHIDSVGLMPKQSAPRCRARRHEKGQLMDIVKLRAETGKLEEMVDVFGQIEKCFQSVLDMSDYHYVIVSLARGGDPTTAHMWLRRSMAVGLKPLPGAFSSTILSYGKQRMIAQAMDVVEDMKLAGVEANAVTFNAIMDAWARAGDVDKVQDCMKRMMHEGIRPNVVSFSIVLSACATAGWLEGVDVWFDLSQNLGFELNDIAFDCVIRAFVRNNDVANAMKWVGMMVDSGVKPTLSCCMQLLTSIFETHDLELVDSLIARMRATGVEPDGPFFSRCILLGAKGGHSIEAQRWADECAMGKMRLTWAAKQTMIEAGLSLRMFARADQDSPAEVVVGIGCVDAPEHVDSDEMETQRRRIEEGRASRNAAIGKRFSGIVKEFVPRKFGYIECDATYDLFQRDVFLGRHDNPKGYTKGQRVSFTLCVDVPYGLPRASDVSAVRSFSS